MTTSLLANSRESLSSFGISSRHGPHQVAQKSRTTALPLSEESCSSLPFKARNRKSGARRPINGADFGSSVFTSGPEWNGKAGEGSSWRDRDSSSGLSGCAGHVLCRHHQEYWQNLSTDVYRYLHEGCFRQALRSQKCTGRGRSTERSCLAFLG